MGKFHCHNESNSDNNVRQQEHTEFGKGAGQLLNSASARPHASNHQQQQHGGLHKKIKQSKIAKHTSDYLQRKLANMTLKHVKNSSVPEEMPPIIVHFHHNSSNYTRASRDSDSIMSNSSAATTLTWRATLGPEDNELVASLSPKQIKYQELLHELVMTEETYLSDLQLVQQVFVTDLQPSWNSLPEPIQRTFESLHVIIEFHTAVLANLRECQSAQPPLIVGDVVERFRNYIPHIFNVYKEYFANFESANDLIAKSLSNPQTASLKALGQYVQERCSYPECRSLTLQSFLLKPVQRLMKYPLFLKSQIECFEENDEAIHQHVQCMSEMDAAIRSIEEYKIRAEQALRLADLGERIRNLKEVGIQLNQPHRRLVHEGPLILVPPSSSSSFSKSFSSGKTAAYLAPQRSFSESSKQLFLKQKIQPLYVFLFNDLVLFTKIRTKRISQAESELRINMSGGTKLYGPAPDVLFKLATVPGQITHLDRIVLQSGSSTSGGTNNRSAWFGSFCRSGSSTTVASRNKGSSGASSVLSHSYHQNFQQQQNLEQNVNPLQFTCSIASKSIVNMLLEAKTPEEKQLWCDCIDSVRDEHCQRGDTGGGAENGNTSSNHYYNGSDKRIDELRESLATESKNITTSSANSNDHTAEAFNTSWFSENSLRSLMAGQLLDDDDDGDEDSDELSSIYSSILEEGAFDKSLQSSIFSTEGFSISSQPQSKVDC